MSGQPRETFGPAESKKTSRAVAAELAELSLGPATKYAALPDPFRFWRGGALSSGQVAYETWGSLNAARDNAVLLFTGLSPSAHAASSPAATAAERTKHRANDAFARNPAAGTVSSQQGAVH